MLITGVFFVLGLVVLKSVDPERGRRAATVGFFESAPTAAA